MAQPAETPETAFEDGLSFRPILRIESIRRLHQAHREHMDAGLQYRRRQFPYPDRVTGITRVGTPFRAALKPVLMEAGHLARYLKQASASVAAEEPESAEVADAWARFAEMGVAASQTTQLLTGVAHVDIDTAVPRGFVIALDQLLDLLPHARDRAPGFVDARAAVDAVRAERARVNALLADTTDPPLPPAHVAAQYLRDHADELYFHAGTEAMAASIHCTFEGRFERADSVKAGVVKCGLVESVREGDIFETRLRDDVDNNHGRGALVYLESELTEFGNPQYGCGFLSRAALEAQGLEAYGRPHEECDWTLAGIETGYARAGASRGTPVGVGTILDAIMDAVTGLPELRDMLVHAAGGSHERAALMDALFARLIHLDKSTRKADCGVEIHGPIEGPQRLESTVSVQRIVPANRGPSRRGGGGGGGDGGGGGGGGGSGGSGSGGGGGSE